MNLKHDLELGFGKKLPVILQAETAECGLVCLLMITAYHGLRVQMADLRRRFAISLKGLNLRQVTQIAGRLGLGTRALSLDIAELGSLQIPCILHWNFDHFVVLASVNKRYVEVHDPARGKYRVRLDELSDRFTGVALELWPNSSFEKKEKPPSLMLLSVFGKVSGVGASLCQILVMGLSLQVIVLLSPFLMQWTVDHAIASEDNDLLLNLVLGFFCVLLIQSIISTARSWALIYLSTQFSLQWRTNVFTHLLRLPCDFFEKRHLGDVVSRFSSVDQIQQTLTVSFLSIIIDGLMAISTGVLLLLYSPKLAAIVVCAIAAYALLRLISYGPLRRAQEEQIVHAARQQTYFLESIRGIRTLKLFEKVDLRRSGWLTLFVEQINAGLKGQKLQLLYAQTNTLIFGIENLLIIWIGANMAMAGFFSIGMLLAFYSYKSQFGARMSSLIDRIFDLKMLQLHGERLADIVLEPPERETAAVSGTVTIPLHLELDAVSFRYGDLEHWVLRDLNLELSEGESIAIVGASGCGKSTLLKVMMGMVPVGEGCVRIAGYDILGEGNSILRSSAACVMQDDVLFAGTLAENICFFDLSPDADWMRECASTVGIDSDIQRMTMGYNTLVGDMGTTLSGGQKQRILLARALYRRPKILVLDEATSHLDVDSERQINSELRRLAATRIVISHRTETIASANRIIELNNGSVIRDTSYRNF